VKFKLYTKNTCPYCHAAVRLLAENKMSFECHSLDTKPQLLTEIKEKHNWGTVPMIFDISEGQEKFIGGFTDLQEYLLKGKQLLKG
jgi:glutaredoxin